MDMLKRMKILILENGRPNALKVKPTVLMDSGYFDLNDRVGSIFKTCKGSR